MESTAISLLLVLTVVIFFGQLTLCRSANILYISSVASPSHFLWSQRLFERLAELGHNVTVLNLYKSGFARGVHLVKLEGIIDELEAEEEDYVEFGQLNPFEMLASFADLELHVCRLAVRSSGFRSLMEYPKEFRFELVIHDHLAGPCMLSLLDKFDYPPLIFATAYNRQSTLISSLGAMVYPGFITNQVYDVEGSMTFRERFINHLIALWEIFFKEFIYHPKLDNFLKAELNQSFAVSSLEKRSLLAILNSNSILEPSEPKLPNVLQAGGLHINSPRKLPSYLFKLNKIVLFSLGTNARSDLLSPETLHKLLTAMSSLPELNFIWKLESGDECLPRSLPSNVHTFPWIPQNDLLAHPQTLLFITHGGLLSIQEAAWHGVPLIGMPLYADQYGNVNQMVRKGAAKRVSLVDCSSEDLVDAIMDVISNESYKRNAMQLSKLLQDQKESPLDAATWTIEWILRNADSNHIWKQSLTDVRFVEKYSLDVLLVFVGLALTGLALLLLSLKILLTCTSGRNKPKTD